MPNLHLHCGFGLDFQSEIPIPEMRAGQSRHGEPVIIRLGDAPCPASLPNSGAGFAAGPCDFWMDVPKVARLLVQSGTCVTVEPADGATEDDIRAYLLGSAIGALLHQRGALPLHASVVAIDGTAVAFTGPSGAGKSSLALALVKRGHQLLCDDIAAVDMSGDHPMVSPGLVTLKLWADSITAANERPDGLRPVLGTMNKYLRPVTVLAANQGMRLGHVVKLAFADPDRAIIDPVCGSDRAAMLVANTFRGQLITPMGEDRKHFERCVRLAQFSRIWTLSRPKQHEAMAATCLLIENLVRTS